MNVTGKNGGPEPAVGSSAVRVSGTDLTVLPPPLARLETLHRVFVGAELQERTITVSVRDLYPVLEPGDAPLGEAIRLLSEMLQYSGDATVALRRGEVIDSDDALLKVSAALPELFACRSIGDGFGMVVGAIVVAFRMHTREPFTLGEAEALQEAMKALLDAPYMAEEKAANIVDRLEDAGLEVTVAGVERMVDERGDDSVS